MSAFIFESYAYDARDTTATFRYSFDDGRTFQEKVMFAGPAAYNKPVLDNALFLAFVLIGVSYYKTFPTTDVRMTTAIDQWQATFFQSVYQDGLSQYAFENNLSRNDLARFNYADHSEYRALVYEGEGVLALQSGGKDSLLTAALLEERNVPYSPWYVASGEYHPDVLDGLASNLVITQRTIDRHGLSAATAQGGKNGHVPITYIIQSLAVVQAVLLGKQQIVVSIAHEGEEPYAHIGDMPVRHQWSKIWDSEQQFAQYVQRYISPDIHIGSPLRQYSELKVAQLFADYAWDRFSAQFSSCNVANYTQGSDNTTLRWCGHCAKCANSYLLFAPFVDAPRLQQLFGGQDLFTSPILQDIFKGLLVVDDAPKPFECVGETDELRTAYHMAQAKAGYGALLFDVPAAAFDWQQTYPAQSWASEMLQ